MNLAVPPALEAEIDELVSHYPQKRSASLMLLHRMQEHYGAVNADVVDWIARKLGLQPINVHELVTFYPMFRETPAGKFHFRVCRTLSCALGGGTALHRHLCDRLGLDPHQHGVQTTPDGRYSLEYVECLAGCGSAPVMMLNELECVGPSIFANIWQTDTIVRIDRATGFVTGVIDAAGLLSEIERLSLQNGSVLNGIVYDPAHDTFLITGKRWPAIFEVRFIPYAP